VQDADDYSDDDSLSVELSTDDESFELWKGGEIFISTIIGGLPTQPRPQGNTIAA
jgi:hypothetical protein